MTKDEALKLALEALKTIDEAMPFPVAKLAQAAIKEALAQPERPWVGLTNEEIYKIYRDCGDLNVKINIARAIEAKLKEKNT